MGLKIDLTNKRSGKLVFLEATDERKHGCIIWNAMCDCGNFTKVKATLYGIRVSCGCANSKDLTNKRSGKLVFLEPTDERKNDCIVWKTICDCGNYRYVATNQFGKIKSCGCADKKKGSHGRDLTNLRYEKLLFLKPTDERKNNNIVWLAICDCGNYTKVSTNHFGKIKSCGCAEIDRRNRKRRKDMALSDIYTERLSISMTPQTKEFLEIAGAEQGMKGGSFTRLLLEKISNNGNGLLGSIMCDDDDDNIEWIPDDAIEVIEDEDEDTFGRISIPLNVIETEELLKRLPISARKTGNWILESPKGKYYKVTNLKQFCKANKINYETIKSTFKRSKGAERRKDIWRIVEQKRGDEILHPGDIVNKAIAKNTAN